MSDALQVLTRRFGERCRQNCHELAALVAARDEAGLKLLSHKLVGAAATFGHPGLSEAAAAVEDQLDLGGWPDAAALDRLRIQLAAVADA